MMGQRSPDAVLQRAFETAAVDPDSWLNALQAMADATGSLRGQLIGIGGPQHIPFNWVTDMMTDALADFVAIGGGSPDVNYRVAASLESAVGEVAHDPHYQRAIPKLGTDIYLDYCDTYDIPFGIQTKLVEDDGLIGLAVLRTRSEGAADEKALAAFGEAAGYAGAAVRIQFALERQAGRLVAGTLEAMDIAAFVIDGTGAVSAMTPHGEVLVRGGDGLRVVDGHLCAAWPSDRVRLDMAIARALACEERHSHAGVMLRAGAAGSETLLVSLITLPGQPWSFNFRPRVIAVAKRPRPRGRGAVLLTDLFQLTPAESAVALLVAEGKSRAEIAAERRVSSATVMAQLKSIFHKTGVTREAALVARLRDLLD
ncbi:helix-turn-helix transcriptional regulator [Allosphingosinicella indica]|uniref:DNA-binding transcriptional regulator, CsgD family n=1 Tax=Allosphingosinicella indica TaxID=941907 RepID=A0A1X7GIG3_9SPHN|nr:helix-turn-helix transcriptional regulator [Allosphingosinicella indica]SMF70244.1 DNA-binding transcriptional regulator, CsgD family [Allosphingosinicella indica]